MENQTTNAVRQQRLQAAAIDQPEDRARVSCSPPLTAFSPGRAYFHAGVDTLRSKSMDRNSFNSGDWFNRLDWSYATTTSASRADARRQRRQLF